MSVPILLLIFNRPDTTQKVFDAIRQQKPSHLYVAADGPREHHKQDLEQCAITYDLLEKHNYKNMLVFDNIGNMIHEKFSWDALRSLNTYLLKRHHSNTPYYVPISYTDILIYQDRDGDIIKKAIEEFNRTNPQ